MLKQENIPRGQMNRIAKILMLIILCSVFAGCALFLKNEKNTKRNELEEIRKVTDMARLQKGGSLLIIPFRAGPGVVATEELDRISLMFVKGVIEILEKNSSPFKILNASNADTADLVMKGHVVRFAELGKKRSWIPIARSLDLSFEGKIIERETGRVVFYFARRRTSPPKFGDYKSMAYDMGKEIGQFLLDQIH